MIKLVYLSELVSIEAYTFLVFNVLTSFLHAHVRLTH
jgi:hypothetical protein